MIESLQMNNKYKIKQTMLQIKMIDDMNLTYNYMNRQMGVGIADHSMSM